MNIWPRPTGVGRGHRKLAVFGCLKATFVKLDEIDATLQLRNLACPAPGIRKINMQISSKTSAEEKLAAMRKKANLALKEKEIARQIESEKTAKLRALRLARDAAAES